MLEENERNMMKQEDKLNQTNKDRKKLIDTHPSTVNTSTKSNN